ncbi:MAG TPA: hypothetical protein PLS81_09690 [Deltaproteobacteria bacterium]|nr:hypothetical protein [Deltaproteobacteria bacterium]HPP79858.1 hypothetical protein [Deltaproteobacteria bacterium]
MSKTRQLLLTLSRVAFAVIVLAVLSCHSENGGQGTVSTEPLLLDLERLYSDVEAITVEVAYETGAEPYTDDGYDRPFWWEILKTNLEALAGPTVNVTVPWELSRMTGLGPLYQDGWTTSEIVGVAQTLWDATSPPEEQVIHVLFLNGYYEDAEGIKDRMLGVSFGGTSLIAVFKDVVESSSGSGLVKRYVEQATLVHEAGHLLGLVNNGVVPCTAHEDPEHPRHCANPVCVMFWLNEGPQDLADFVALLSGSGDLVLFCQDCLDDVSSYRSSLSSP